MPAQRVGPRGRPDEIRKQLHLHLASELAEVLAVALDPHGAVAEEQTAA